MSSQNIINNTVSDNDFSVNLATAGSTVTLSSNQTDNSSATSHAEIRAQAGGTSGGDAFLRFNIPSGQDYSFGIDNSTSGDPLTLTDDADPSTGNILMTIGPSYGQTLPLQCAANSYVEPADSNVTGDSSTYVWGTNTNLSSRFDQNSDITQGGASGWYISAPISGMYMFKSMVTCSASNNSSNLLYDILTSNNTFRGDDCAPNSQYNTSSNGYGTTVTQIVELDAADTAKIQYNVTNSGGKVVQLGGLSATRIRNAIQVYLVC